VILGAVHTMWFVLYFMRQSIVREICLLCPVFCVTIRCIQYAVCVFILQVVGTPCYISPELCEGKPYPLICVTQNLTNIRFH